MPAFKAGLQDNVIIGISNRQDVCDFGQPQPCRAPAGKQNSAHVILSFYREAGHVKREAKKKH